MTKFAAGLLPFRIRAFRVGFVCVMGVLAASLGGCAGNNEATEGMRTLQERNNALVAHNKDLEDALNACNGEKSAQAKTLADLMALRARMLAENDSLRDALAKFDENFRNIKFGGLDADTDAALRDLAAQFPDILEYDQARGMVRFKSDFTFASGSDVVSENGRRSIDALAHILTGEIASKYDVRIVGHTDSQRISGGTAPKHPTNWHLSTHRAISVANELIKTSVAPTRVEAAGRGEYDPMVPNTGNGNTPQNRRVELFLVRSAGNKQGAMAAPAPATKRTPAVKKEEDIVK